MTATRLRDLGLAFVAAWIGYRVFAELGVPAAPLTGSAAAVTLVALSGVNADLPAPLRNAVILVLGVNIGTAVTPAVLAGALSWPVSLGLLVATLFATMVVSTALMVRLFGYDRDTALLSSIPGHLSYVLSIVAETGRDVPVVAVLQSIRVLLLTLCVPPLVSAVFGATGISVLPEAVMSPGHIVLVCVLSVPVAFGLARLRVPAAFLLAGMALSALGHGTGVTPGRLPDTIGVAAFLMMGTLIGSRFSATTPAQVIRLVLPGVVITLVAVGFALIGVVLSVWLLGVPPGLLVVAFAPGGVEAMAAIALALGYDPTFVAAHHVFRLAVLSVCIPVIFARMRR